MGKNYDSGKHLAHGADKEQHHGGGGGGHDDNDVDGNFDGNASFAEEASKSSNSGTGSGTGGDDTTNKLGKKETKYILYTKSLVGVVLLVSSVLISFGMYYVTRQGEMKQFQNEFKDQAVRIKEEFGINFLHTLSAVDNLGISITSHVSSMNLQWPYAYVPEFDIRGDSTNTLANSKFLGFYPMVKEEEKNKFQNYTVGLSFWIDQAVARKHGLPVPESPSAAVHNHDISGSEGGGVRRREKRALQDGGEHVDHSTTGTTTAEDSHGGMDHSATTATTSTSDTGHSSEHVMTDHSNMDPSSSASSSSEVLPSSANMSPFIFKFDEYGNKIPDIGHEGHDYFPLLECTPVLPDAVNFNLLSHPHLGAETRLLIERKDIVIGKVLHYHQDGDDDENTTATTDHGAMDQHGGHSQHLRRKMTGEEVENDSDKEIHEVYDPFQSFLIDIAKERNGELPSTILFPIFDTFDRQQRELSGMLSVFVYWSDFFPDNLPSTVQNIVGVIANTCGGEDGEPPQIFSFEINAHSKATYLGRGDYHDHSGFHNMEEFITFNDFVNQHTEVHDSLTYSGVTLNKDHCPFTLRIYPSVEMRERNLTNKPIWYATFVACTFLFTAIVLVGYDVLVEKRQRIIMENARQSNMVLSSLFPKIVRDRMFADPKSSRSYATAKHRLRQMLENEINNDANAGATSTQDDTGITSRPIADLFTDCTVLFADISGFTAWASVREPAQVFMLLETIYGSFDNLCKQRKVFKVETVGDCYVAVTGLPDPQNDHAVRMALFAKECLNEFGALTQKLETKLGPDTGDLRMRVGLNSGQVTAGVLRGEKSRFQLFGDTVNTASRMESTGLGGQIHCSQATADLLIAADKHSWIALRRDIVQVKGKGTVQTYWVNPELVDLSIFKDLEKSVATRRRKSGAAGNQAHLEQLVDSQPIELWGEESQNEISAQEKRLIEWHVEVLSRLLREILSQRTRSTWRTTTKRVDAATFTIEDKKNPRDEYADVINMPVFDAKKAKKFVDPDTIELEPEVVSQLRDFVAAVASMYRGNHFHNFAHASHVTMAANKLLSRVVAPENVYNRTASTKTMASNLHDYTFGTSDPLTLFACSFSALIHDLDHCGVSNGQLVKENSATAIKYEGKSVAEQNSIDLAWGILMDPSLDALRSCIYSTEAEFKRFRQLVVNSVMATDIFDSELKAMRNSRWDRAFHSNNQEQPAQSDNIDHDTDMKATIVIEHIIQAADVSHTMQHWHVYQKFNKRLFYEMYKSFKEGRNGDKDPATTWYNGELWFFDNYVLPLGEKLKECQVFGVASAECLNFAKENRKEWALKGREIVEQYVKEYNSALEDELGTSSLQRSKFGAP